MSGRSPRDETDEPHPTHRRLLEQTLTATRKSYYPQLQAQLASVQSSQRQLQLLIDSLPARISYVDTQRRYVFVNHAYERVFGMPREAIIGKTVAEIIGEADYAQVSGYIDRVLTGKAVSFEIDVTDPDGGSAWIEVTYVPDLNTRGEVIGYYTLTRDRSELRVREAELRDERDLLDSLFDNILLGISLWSADGELTRINQGFSEITGYTIGDVPNLNAWCERAYPDPAYRDVVLQTWKADQRRQRAVRDFRVTCADGEEREIEFRSSFLADGRALVTLSDISERKSAEAQIRQNERRFRGMFESAPVGMAIIDTQRRFIEVNQQICRLLGYQPAEMVGRSLNAFTHPDDREGGRRRWRELLGGEVRFNQAEKRYLHKDGRVIWAIVSNTLIRDDRGNPSYFLSHLIDISAQKQAQADKVAYEKKLVQAQKMEAIGTLAGGLAHDFNNLLMAIQGRASLMLLDLPDSHPLREHVDSIETHVRSAAALAHQLLGYARGGKYDVRSVQLNDLLRDSATMFGRTKKEIEIHLDLATNLPAIEADRNQIEQVLLNLFVNAWQAMPEGGQLHLATAVAGPAEVPTAGEPTPAGDFVKASVTDTGIGMEEATVEKIFDPFFTTKEKSRGTGLGLASVYGIVKNHGGHIAVTSAPGEGTTFVLYFPISRTDAQAAIQRTKSIEKGRETLLLVDDEEMIRDVGSSLLERLGYQVLAAGSGIEAINLAAERSDEIALVILDLVMPGMDGSLTFDRIKAVNPRLKVILSSGYACEGKAETVMQKGCDGFIQKPFDLATLSEMVRRILDED